MSDLVANRYQKLERLEAGLAEVWRCNDNNLGRLIVLKTLNVSGEHKRLFDELHALQTIRSKHVVEVLDIVHPKNSNSFAIIEEFLPGNDLTDVACAPDEFVKFVYQIASGLADIHSHNIIHRDIKPANLRRTLNNIIKIIDFNLARPTKDAATVGFVGTRGFAAPELHQPGHVNFTTAADIYSAGATFVYLLNGNRLPDALEGGPAEVETWLQSGNIQRLCLTTGALQDLPLMGLIARSLLTNPSSRPSAQEIRDRAQRIWLRGKHRARFTIRGQIYDVSDAARGVTLNIPGIGSITITYDGLDFTVYAVDGDIWINNNPVNVGQAVPTSAVIAFGGVHRKPAERDFATVDVSFPEVIL